MAIRVPLTLSTTALKDAALCLKLYEYKHVDRLAPRPKDSAPRMRRGVWIHRALEYDAAGKDYSGGLDECYRWAIEHGVGTHKADEILDECYRILKGYFAYYAQQPQWNWRVVWAEKSLTYEHDGIVLRATPDELVEWRGQLWNVEHKSTNEIPSPTWRAVDPQSALQLLLFRLNGYEVAGTIFDYLITREPTVPRVKKDGRFYAVSADGRTSSTAFDQAEQEVSANWKHDETCGAFNEDGGVTHNETECALAYVADMKLKMVNDDQFYQRFEVYRPEGSINESFADALGTARQILQARKFSRYPRLNNLLYCQRFCGMSNLCASEYTYGRKLEVMRETDYIVDNPDTREGRGEIL